MKIFPDIFLNYIVLKGFFTYTILNYENSPPKLKEIIILPDKSTNYKEIDQYNFRQGAKANNIIPLTKYEHLTFRFFFETDFKT